MSPTPIADRSDLETITTVIARSPIVVASQTEVLARLPAGFDEVDVAILRWIALESRRAALARH